MVNESWILLFFFFFTVSFSDLFIFFTIKLFVVFSNQNMQRLWEEVDQASHSWGGFRSLCRGFTFLCGICHILGCKTACIICLDWSRHSGNLIHHIFFFLYCSNFPLCCSLFVVYTCACMQWGACACMRACVGVCCTCICICQWA